MKILLIGEFSGLQNELKHGLIKLGHEVTLAAANDFYKKYPADIDLGHGNNIYSYKLRQLIYPLLNLKKLTGYDVVHVVNFYTIPRLASLNIILLNYLKSNNGILTLSGAGDDPFFVTHSSATMSYSPIPWHEKFDRNGRLHYMRSKSQMNAMHECMKIVDRVIPIMYEYYSTFVSAGYGSITSNPIPIPIDSNKFADSLYSKSDKTVFFHGLNRPGFKGTFLIEEAFNRLANRYPNDVECIIDGKMAFPDYLKVLAKTHVSVDQVFSYSLAMNALYSMAQGKVVCGGAEIESGILYGGITPPVFNLKPDVDQIFDTFVTVLDQRENFDAISAASREFVKKYHDSVCVAQRYLDCWCSILPNNSNY